MVKDLKETEVIRTVRQSTVWWKGVLYSMLAAITYSIIVGLFLATVAVTNPQSTAGKAIQAFFSAINAEQ